MISKETIEEVKNRLIKIYDPLTIYLFGSYAWGHPTDDSDLDLLVIVDKSDEKPQQRGFRASDALWDIIIPKDLLIYTKDEFLQKEHDTTTLCHKIKLDGRILYARS